MIIKADGTHQPARRITYFGDLRNCLNHLMSRRGPDGVTCPMLGGTYGSVEPFHLFRYLNEQS
jgi:hypothetical protein